MRTVIALFDDSVGLERALDKLYASGIDEESVRIIDGPAGGLRGDAVTGDAVLGGAPVVAGTGAFATPGSSTGMAMPAVAGAGLFGELSGYGISEEEERFFSDRLSEGGRVLVFRVDDDEASRAYGILREAGASQLNDAGVA